MQVIIETDLDNKFCDSDCKSKKDIKDINKTS